MTSLIRFSKTLRSLGSRLCFQSHAKASNSCLSDSNWRGPAMKSAKLPWNEAKGPYSEDCIPPNAAGRFVSLRYPDGRLRHGTAPLVNHLAFLLDLRFFFCIFARRALPALFHQRKAYCRCAYATHGPASQNF